MIWIWMNIFKSDWSLVGNISFEYERRNDDSHSLCGGQRHFLDSKAYNKGVKNHCWFSSVLPVTWSFLGTWCLSKDLTAVLVAKAKIIFKMMLQLWKKTRAIIRKRWLKTSRFPWQQISWMDLALNQIAQRHHVTLFKFCGQKKKTSLNWHQECFTCFEQCEKYSIVV